MTQSSHGFITVKWGKKCIFVDIPSEKSCFPAGERLGVSYGEKKEWEDSKVPYLKQGVKGTSTFLLS